MVCMSNLISLIYIDEFKTVGKVKEFNPDVIIAIGGGNVNYNVILFFVHSTFNK